MLPLWFIYLQIILFGLLIGSFINVCIYRLPLNKSIIFPASHCTSCRSVLKFLDLIPVISFIIFNGKCRYCKTKISIRYPLVEILTATILLINYYFFGFSFKFLINSIVSLVFLVATFIDFDYQIIPNEITIGGLIAAFFFQIILNILAPELFNYFYKITLTQSLLGALIGGGFLYIIAILSRGGMGGGDVKLAAFIGALYGSKIVIFSLFLSFLLGGIIGILLIILRIKGRKDFIPFGPYICLGTLLTIWFSPEYIYITYVNLIRLII